MTKIETRNFLFKKELYWFSSKPVDSPRCSAVYFHAVPNKVDLKGFTCRPSPTFLIDLNQDSDSILKNMKKSCRYEVNKALRSNLLIEKNQNHQAFFEIYKDFVRDKGFAGNIGNYWPLTERGTLYTCSHEGSLIGGLLTLEDETTSRWLMSGSNRLSSDDSESRKLAGLANRGLVWEAIIDAKSRGKQQFDFGGYYPGDDKKHPQYGIAIFKRGFGGEEVMQYNYYKIYSPLMRTLKKLKVALKRTE